MTAKTTLLPISRKFTKAEIGAIVAVAQDRYCPDVMPVFLVELAARCGRQLEEGLEISSMPP
jgi:hypothetical protein